MNQLTLRQIPDAVERRLRELARREGKSLNKTVVSLLAAGLGLEKPSRRRRDLSGIAGAWSEAEAAEFDRNTAVFDRIDEELWT